MNCPICRKKHRKFPYKCERISNKLTDIDRAIMQVYLKSKKFDIDSEVNTLQGWSDIIMNRK